MGLRAPCGILAQRWFAALTELPAFSRQPFRYSSEGPLRLIRGRNRFSFPFSRPEIDRQAGGVFKAEGAAGNAKERQGDETRAIERTTGLRD